MTGETGGFRLDLKEPVAGMLADFCEAFFDSNKTEVIRQRRDCPIAGIPPRDLRELIGYVDPQLVLPLLAQGSSPPVSRF